MGTEKRERQKAGRAQRIEQARLAARKAQRRRQFITIGAVVAVAAVLIGISAYFNNRSKNEVATGSSAPSTTSALGSTTTSIANGPFQYGTGPCPPEGGSPQPVLTFSTAPMLCIDPAKSYTATFDTTAGTVKVSLDTVRTPGTANNFVVLGRYGYYNGTKIFRTDTSIDILQGGAPHDNSASDPGPGYTIPDEGGKFTYQPGQLVMARTQGPNSAGAQFFFSAGPKTANLDNDGSYVVFGNVTEGLDVLQKVLATNVDTGGGLGGAPNPPVTVNSVTIAESNTPATPAPTAPPAPAPVASVPAG